MRPERLIALGMAAATPALAIAAEPLPFVPPIDRDLILVVEQQGWTRAGEPMRYRFERRLRFGEDRAGRFVAVTLVSATGDGEAETTARLVAATAAMQGVAIRCRLSKRAAIEGVDDADAAWFAFRRGQVALAGRLTDAGEQAKAVQVMAMIDRAPAAERVATLCGDVAPLLRFAGAARPPAEAGDDLLVVREDDGERDLRSEATYRVSTRSGLVLAVDRRTVIGADAARPVVEQWRLIGAD